MSRLLCSSWSSPGLTGDDRQIRGVTTLVTRTEASVDWSWWQNIIIKSFKQLYHVAAFMFRTVQCRGHSGWCLVIGCWWPLVMPPGSGHLWPGVGCRGPASVIRVLASTGPARPAPAARPGPRTLHPQQTSWVSPVTRRAARIEDRYITQVSRETETRGIPAGILPYFLHFCILLICQYLLSADKHQPQSTKEALVNTAPIEY